MEKGEFLSELPPEEKKRLAYIEGREDLFRTKVLEFEQEKVDSSDEKKINIVVESRDPGGANALSPVLELLQKEKDIEIKAVVDGRAQEIIQKKFKTKDITPQDNILRAAEIIGSPDFSLVGISDESGIEMFVAATFPEVPGVLVEDYYGASLGYLRRLKETGLPYPKKICVLDKAAKDIIIENFPELTSEVEITGQPAFDRFAHENREKISGEVRNKLGIKPDEKLVAFMSAMEGVEPIRRFAEELSKVNKKTKIKLAFRIHPRDNTPLEDYEREFKNRGVDCVETRDMPTDSVGIASDLVITTTSTEGLHAICRGKPSINIVDQSVIDRVSPPSVMLGASFGVDRVENLANCVEKLLDPESKESKELKRNMKKYYPVDGKNSQRVVNAIANILNNIKDEKK